MGDIADAFEKAYFLRQGFGYKKSNNRPKPDAPVTCANCGKTNLKWRAQGGKWILVENERVHPGNYKPEHPCPTSADGFEEVL